MHIARTGETSKFLEAPPTKEELKRLDGALFTQKLEIENIDKETIYYSKNTFFYTDSYIRKLKSFNIPMEVIQGTFSACYEIYFADRYTEYRMNKNSQVFVEGVIKKVENANFQSLKDEISPKKNQKSGLIHLLANDKELDVRWGEKEIE